MPFLAMIRQDIPKGSLQVLDLVPNTSQHSIYDPPSQSKYVHYGEYTGTATGARPTTVAATAHLTTRVCYGLAAYFVDTIVSATTGVGYPAAAANAAATLVVTNILAAGAVVSNATVTTELQAAAGAQGDEQLNAGGSIGTVADVLQIFAGGSYLLPAASAETVAVAGMGNGGFEAGTYRRTEAGLPLSASWNNGKLATMVAATYDPFQDGTTGIGIIVWNDDGTLYTG